MFHKGACSKVLSCGCCYFSSSLGQSESPSRVNMTSSADHCGHMKRRQAPRRQPAEEFVPLWGVSSGLITGCLLLQLLHILLPPRPCRADALPSTATWHGRRQPPW